MRNHVTVPNYSPVYTRYGGCCARLIPAGLSSVSLSAEDATHVTFGSVTRSARICRTNLLDFSTGWDEVCP
jgi:hypothetical protein